MYHVYQSLAPKEYVKFYELIYTLSKWDLLHVRVSVYLIACSFLGAFLQDVLCVIWLTFLKTDLLCMWNITPPASQWGESLHRNNSSPLGNTESFLSCRIVFMINHIFHSFFIGMVSMCYLDWLHACISPASVSPVLGFEAWIVVFLMRSKETSPLFFFRTNQLIRTKTYYSHLGCLMSSSPDVREYKSVGCAHFWQSPRKSEGSQDLMLSHFSGGLMEDTKCCFTCSQSWSLTAERLSFPSLLAKHLFNI